MATHTRRLNPRQIAFAREYIANGGNALQAALSAGYAYATAKASSKRLLDHAGISWEIERRQRARDAGSDSASDM